MKNFLVAFAVIFLLLGCQNNNSEPDKNGSFFPEKNKKIGVVNEGTTLIPTGIIPYYNPALNDIVDLIYSKLIKFNEKGKLVGDLALSWKVLSQNTIEFQLHKNIVWHDGKPLVLNDIKKSFEIAKNTGIIDFDNLTLNIENNNLKIISDKNISPENISNIFILPYHILNETNLQNSSLLYNPVGTGAFKFESLDKNQLKLKNFKNYFKKKVFVSEYNWIFVNNYDELFKKFRNNEINIFKLKTNPKDYVNAVEDFKQNKKIYLSNDFQVLAINPRSKNLDSSNSKIFFTNIIKNVNNNLIDNRFYQKFEIEAPDENLNVKVKPKRILLIVEDDEYILKIANKIKNIWEKIGVETVLQKKSFVEIVYYINKGFKSDGILFNWKNLKLSDLNNFYGLNFQEMSLESALKMLTNSGYIVPFTRKLNFVFYKNIKGLKVNYNFGINHPEEWYF